MIVVKIDTAEASGANVICQVSASEDVMDKKGAVLTATLLDTWQQTWDAGLGVETILQQAVGEYQRRVDEQGRIEEAIALAKELAGAEVNVPEPVVDVVTDSK